MLATDSSARGIPRIHRPRTPHALVGLPAASRGLHRAQRPAARPATSLQPSDRPGSLENRALSRKVSPDRLIEFVPRSRSRTSNGRREKTPIVCGPYGTRPAILIPRSLLTSVPCRAIGMYHLSPHTSSIVCAHDAITSFLRDWTVAADRMTPRRPGSQRAPVGARTMRIDGFLRASFGGHSRTSRATIELRLGRALDSDHLGAGDQWRGRAPGTSRARSRPRSDLVATDREGGHRRGCRAARSPSTARRSLFG